MNELIFTENAIDTKMRHIEQIKEDYSKQLSEATKGLMDLSSDFSSYEELFFFVKKATKTQEEFNLAMFSGRQIFLDKL